MNTETSNAVLLVHVNPFTYRVTYRAALGE